MLLSDAGHMLESTVWEKQPAMLKKTVQYGRANRVWVIAKAHN